MPLRYERAAGDADASNPVGVRMTGMLDRRGNARPESPTWSRSVEAQSHISPIGFGPIAPSWPDRRDKLGRHRDSWPGVGWYRQPLPEGISPGYFNVAPRDQQVQELRHDERIVLEHLHPEHARLVTVLPGVKPRAVVERIGRAPEHLRMRADTLWIDTDRAVCTLTWRGQVQLESLTEQGRIVIDKEDGRALPTQFLMPGASEAEDNVRTILTISQQSATLPFVEGESPLATPGSGAATPREMLHGDHEMADSPAQTLFLPEGAAPLKAAPLPFPPAHRASARLSHPPQLRRCPHPHSPCPHVSYSPHLPRLLLARRRSLPTSRRARGRVASRHPLVERLQRARLGLRYQSGCGHRRGGGWLQWRACSAYRTKLRRSGK